MNTTEKSREYYKANKAHIQAHFSARKAHAKNPHGRTFKEIYEEKLDNYKKYGTVRGAAQYKTTTKKRPYYAARRLCKKHPHSLNFTEVYQYLKEEYNNAGLPDRFDFDKAFEQYLQDTPDARRADWRASLPRLKKLAQLQRRPCHQKSIDTLKAQVDQYIHTGDLPHYPLQARAGEGKTPEEWDNICYQCDEIILNHKNQKKLRR